MAKAAAVNLGDIFNPPGNAGSSYTMRDIMSPSDMSAPPSTSGSMLPTSRRLASQVRALNSSKSERHGSAQRQPHAGGAAAYLPPPPPALHHHSDGPGGGQQNSRLPPLMHGYNHPALQAGGSRHGSRSPSPELERGSATAAAATAAERQEPGEPTSRVEPSVQTFTTSLPPPQVAPLVASHAYQPKRKPPSAFLHKSPLKHNMEQQAFELQQFLAAGIAASVGAAPPLSGASPAAARMVERLSAAAGDPAHLFGGGGAGGGVGNAPWGVSSVSDLEALDSILDQLVVIDTRMRKALLKGPLIAFETVVPEQHALRAPIAQPRADDERDRTFLTSVKGMVEVGPEGGDDVPAQSLPALPEEEDEPPLLLPLANADLRAAASGATGARTVTWTAADPEPNPQDSAIFKASIPNTGMHPSYTRAYLTSKVMAKPSLVAPPPAPTADHLLRSRPPPFIAAPSYDELCGQIRDVQRQYTCGTTAAAAGQASRAALPPMVPGTVATMAAQNATTNTNQYISGLDGPSLDEVVMQHDLPISLERVRPTFVAMRKAKSARSPSPKMRRLSGMTRTFTTSGDDDDIAIRQ